VEAAVRSFLVAEASHIADDAEFPRVSLAWDPAVVHALSATYARRPEEGLRGIHKQLKTRVKSVMGRANDADLLRRGCTVMLRVYPHDTQGATSSLDVRIIEPVGASFAWWPSYSAPPARPQRTADISVRAAPTNMDNPNPDVTIYEAGGGWATALHARNWETTPEVVWQSAWHSLRDFLWEWRSVVIVLAVISLVAAFAYVPAMQVMAVRTQFRVATLFPSLIMIGQLAGSLVPVMTVALPVAAASYAWHYSGKFRALGWFCVALLVWYVWRRFSLWWRSDAAGKVPYMAEAHPGETIHIRVSPARDAYGPQRFWSERWNPEGRVSSSPDSPPRRRKSMPAFGVQPASTEVWDVGWGPVATPQKDRLLQPEHTEDEWKPDWLWR